MAQTDKGNHGQRTKENMRIMFYQIKNINEEIKIIKWNQTEILALKAATNGMKNSLEGLNCRIKYGEERISEPDNRSVETVRFQ